MLSIRLDSMIRDDSSTLMLTRHTGSRFARHLEKNCKLVNRPAILQRKWLLWDRCHNRIITTRFNKYCILLQRAASTSSYVFQSETSAWTSISLVGENKLNKCCFHLITASRFRLPVLVTHLPSKFPCLILLIRKSCQPYKTLSRFYYCLTRYAYGMP